MSMIDTPRADAKAGYCASCRDGSHSLCASVRCACTTGTHGMRPKAQPLPTPFPRDRALITPLPEVRIPEQEVVPVKHGAELPTGAFPCPDCDATFSSAQALGPHRGKKHGYRTGKQTNPRPAVPPRDGRPRDVSRGNVARRAAEITGRAAAEAEPFDLSAALRLDHLIAVAGEWVDVGIVELRAFPTDDGRLRVRARWVEDGDA